MLVAACLDLILYTEEANDLHDHLCASHLVAETKVRARGIVSLCKTERIQSSCAAIIRTDRGCLDLDDRFHGFVHTDDLVKECGDRGIVRICLHLIGSAEYFQPVDGKICGRSACAVPLQVADRTRFPGDLIGIDIECRSRTVDRADLRIVRDLDLDIAQFTALCRGCRTVQDGNRCGAADRDVRGTRIYAFRVRERNNVVSGSGDNRCM